MRFLVSGPDICSTVVPIMPWPLKGRAASVWPVNMMLKAIRGNTDKKTLGQRIG